MMATILRRMLFWLGKKILGFLLFSFVMHGISGQMPVVDELQSDEVAVSVQAKGSDIPEFNASPVTIIGVTQITGQGQEHPANLADNNILALTDVGPGSADIHQPDKRSTTHSSISGTVSWEANILYAAMSYPPGYSHPDPPTKQLS